MPCRQLLFDGVLAVVQPVHRRVHLVGARAADTQVGAQGGVGPPGQGGQLGGRRAAPGTRSARSARSRARHAGPSSAGRPSVLRHGVHGGDVPVRQRPIRCAPRRRPAPALAPASTASIAVTAAVGQCRQVRQLLVFDLAALAEAAAQIHRLVVAPLPRLVHMTALDPGHVHRTRSSYHTLNTSLFARIIRRRHADYFGYTSRPAKG